MEGRQDGARQSEYSLKRSVKIKSGIVKPEATGASFVPKTPSAIICISSREKTVVLCTMGHIRPPDSDAPVLHFLAKIINWKHSKYTNHSSDGKNTYTVEKLEEQRCSSLPSNLKGIQAFALTKNAVAVSK
ncbi:hypothetical protein MUK42_28645 [Musa troglodytarum]|uniref:Uncharacterized protein n=1 Tax=Musa troglodytarum TaxID=320322 RepID=A0A9E7FGK3_9LILI|nr:hypothetical protein MUK42_28645 [Musa troglodytarum]